MKLTMVGIYLSEPPLAYARGFSCFVEKPYPVTTVLAGIWRSGLLSTGSADRPSLEIALSNILLAEI